MGNEIRILTVENSPADLNLILEQLDNDGISYSNLNVETRADFIKELADYIPDIILSDYSLPEFNAISAIELIKDLSPLTPIIIVTGSNNESIAVECMKKGADDYILKNNIIRLGFAINGALKNKKLKEEKELSEIRYRRLFESAKDGIIILNAENGEIVDVNPFITNNLDYLKEDLIGKHLWDIGFLKDSKFNKDSFLELLEHGYIRYEDLPLRKKDGTSMDVEFVSNVYCVDNAKVIQCNIRDITSRKRSEDALQNSKFLLYTVLQNIPELIWLKDLDGVYLSCNKMFERYFGAPEIEIVGKTDYNFVDKEIANTYRQRDHDAIAAGKPIFYEESITFADNGLQTTMDTIKTPVYNTQGQLMGVLGISRDITKRKKRDRELLKLSSAVENSSASVIMTNYNGDIEYVNQKLCDLTGYTKEEMIGKNPRIMNSGYHDKLFYENLWDTLLAGNNWNGEILNKKKNGDLYWESALISPLLNKEGDITDFVAIKEDITEKKKMYDELIKAKESAESANKLKDAFIANISHEIRTPLNGILGMASLIKEIFPGEIKKEDEELFEGIDYSSQRLIRTVDLILNYSRLQVGEYPLFIKEIDLASICQKLVREFTIEANHKSIELSFLNECKKATLNADDNSIVMAISNLLGNAIKFSNMGSIKLILHKNSNEEIIVDVIDNGIGISEEYLDKIFEPYLQEQIGYGRSYDGVGLGLALVKKVLDLNGATISVKSKKGKGSTFSINFGKASDSLEQKIKLEASSTANSKSRRALILIVEDDAINQRTITRFIEDNYNSIVTNSSEIALDILQNKKIDLILMDLSIAGSKNGLDFTADLKSSNQFSHIPIIAITAHAFEIDKQNALNSGCDDYLAKPFSQKDLLNMIGNYLFNGIK